jgi:hypothetical protein
VILVLRVLELDFARLSQLLQAVGGRAYGYLQFRGDLSRAIPFAFMRLQKIVNILLPHKRLLLQLYI